MKLVALHFTDSGNAERLALLHASDLRYCGAWGKWFGWTGTHWRQDDSEVYRRAKATTRAMLAEAADLDDDELREKFAAFAVRSESKRLLYAMVDLAKHEPAFAVEPTALDADRWLLNVANGTVDLRTGELREHRRADMITRMLPIAFDAKATCPTWLTFLDKVLAAKTDVIEFVWKATGYSLTGDVREQVLFFLLGPGANGKSTFLGAILALLSGYAKQAAPDLLLAKRGEVHPTEQADLHGCRLAVCTEIEAGRALAEVTVKQLTGGDRIKARRMREDFWEFDPTHKIWICANYRPVVRGTDHAIWRRLRLIPFDVTIPVEERDPKLGERLRAEMPGILNWAVQGCLAWQATGLGAPPAVMHATEAYRDEMNIVGAFLAERCELDPSAATTKADLYKAYCTWCETNGEHPVGKLTFGQRMPETVTDAKATGGVRIWRGIRLRTVASGDQWRGSDYERSGARVSETNLETAPYLPLATRGVA